MAVSVNGLPKKIYVTDGLVRKRKLMDIFFGDDSPYIPTFDPGWMFHNEGEEEEVIYPTDDPDDMDARIDRVPIASRRVIDASPFQRWVRDVQNGYRDVSDGLSFTSEEEKKILDDEVVIVED